MFQYPVGLLSDRFDRLTVLSALGFLVMLVSIGIAILGRMGLGALLPLTVCFGMVFTIYPVAMARAQDNIDKKENRAGQRGLDSIFWFWCLFRSHNGVIGHFKGQPLRPLLFHRRMWRDAGFGCLVLTKKTTQQPRRAGALYSNTQNVTCGQQNRSSRRTRTLMRRRVRGIPHMRTSSKKNTMNAFPIRPCYHLRFIRWLI